MNNHTDSLIFQFSKDVTKSLYRIKNYMNPEHLALQIKLFDHAVLDLLEKHFEYNHSLITYFDPRTGKNEALFHNFNMETLKFFYSAERLHQNLTHPSHQFDRAINKSVFRLTDMLTSDRVKVGSHLNKMKSYGFEDALFLLIQKDARMPILISIYLSKRLDDLQLAEAMPVLQEVVDILEVNYHFLLSLKESTYSLHSLNLMINQLTVGVALLDHAGVPLTSNNLFFNLLERIGYKSESGQACGAFITGFMESKGNLNWNKMPVMSIIRSGYCLTTKTIEQSTEGGYMPHTLVTIEPLQQETHSKDRTLQFTNLTKRQSEIVGFVADGLSNKDIAEKMSLSVNTVKCHIQKISSVTSLKRNQFIRLFND